jgi:hypothetical protein
MQSMSNSDQVQVDELIEDLFHSSSHSSISSYFIQFPFNELQRWCD